MVVSKENFGLAGDSGAVLVEQSSMQLMGILNGQGVSRNISFIQWKQTFVFWSSLRHDNQWLMALPFGTSFHSMASRFCFFGMHGSMRPQTALVHPKRVSTPIGSAIAQKELVRLYFHD